MKRFIPLFIGLFLTINSISQIPNILDVPSRFKSDVIRYVVTDDGYTYEPLVENDTSLVTQIGLNCILVDLSIVESVNNLRDEFGLTRLTYSKDISNYLMSAELNDLPLSQGFTWGTYSLFSDYGYVSHFENKELKFCDYLLDFMTLDDDLFLDLTNPYSKEFGISFTQNYEDKTYNFMIFIKHPFNILITFFITQKVI
jgi:hypothetical protein